MADKNICGLAWLLWLSILGAYIAVKSSDGRLCGTGEGHVFLHTSGPKGMPFYRAGFGGLFMFMFRARIKSYLCWLC